MNRIEGERAFFQRLSAQAMARREEEFEAERWRCASCGKPIPPERQIDFSCACSEDCEYGLMLADQLMAWEWHHPAWRPGEPEVWLA